MTGKKLKILKLEEFRFIEDKDPEGIYDRETRENLYWIIEKLGNGTGKGSFVENRLYKKFRNANFGFLLSKNTVTGGVINFNGVLQVDGNFQGEINGPKSLIVGETGFVTAKIRAGVLICKGIIKGNVTATVKVEVHSTGTLVGDIKMPALNIMEGGQFKGNCQMTLNLKKTPKTRKKRKKFFLAG